MSETSTTGDRVRRLRKLRSMSQVDLARTAGLARRTIRDIETGQGNPRKETLHKIAVALDARTSDFTGSGHPGPEPAPGESWQDIRDVLRTRSAGHEDGDAATPAGVIEGVAALKPLGEAHEYSRARLLLPGLLRDAMSLGDDSRSLAARSRALSAAAWQLNMARQFDDAETAAQLAMEAAPGLRDTMEAVSMMTWGLLRQGRSAEAAALAMEWADRAEPRFSKAKPAELAAYGKIMLYLANAMSTDNRLAEARDALRLARAAAVAMGRDIPFSAATTACFGPVSVTVIEAESAVLNWQPDKTLALADRVRGSLGSIGPSSRMRHLLDIASAHAMRREYGDAARGILSVHRKAPEWLAGQRYARNITEDIIRKRRGPLTEELRDLAEAVRLPL